MASNTPITVDPRIINPLVCSPDDPLSRFPRDTLHRIAATLRLHADLIGTSESDPFSSKNHRYAFAMILDGMAGVIEALVDADDLFPREPATGSNEVIIEFAADELEKLTLIAGRKGQSIHDAIQEIVIEALRAFSPDKKPR